MQYPQTEGFGDGLATVGHREFAIDIVRMALDRAGREEQFLGDFLITQILGKQAQNFDFPLTERLRQSR